MTRNRIEGIGQSLDSLFQAKIGRRRLLRAGGLGAATIITAACFDGKVSDAVASTAPSTSPTTKPTVAPVPTSGTGEGAKPLPESKPLPEGFRVPWGNGKYRQLDRSEE